MIDPAAILLVACLAAPSDAPPPPTRVARGTVAAFEIEHPGGPLARRRCGTEPARSLSA